MTGVAGNVQDRSGELPCDLGVTAKGQLDSRNCRAIPCLPRGKPCFTNAACQHPYLPLVCHRLLFLFRTIPALARAPSYTLAGSFRFRALLTSRLNEHQALRSPTVRKIYDFGPYEYTFFGMAGIASNDFAVLRS